MPNMAAVISQHDTVGGLLAKITRVGGLVTAASRRTVLSAERHMPSTVSGVQGNHHDDERGKGLHWSDRANLQVAL